LEWVGLNVNVNVPSINSRVIWQLAAAEQAIEIFWHAVRPISLLLNTKSSAIAEGPRDACTRTHQCQSSHHIWSA